MRHCTKAGYDWSVAATALLHSTWATAQVVMRPQRNYMDKNTGEGIQLLQEVVRFQSSVATTFRRCPRLLLDL